MAVQPCCEVLLNFQPDPPEPETDLLEGPTELRDPGAELVELWELAKIFLSSAENGGSSTPGTSSWLGCASARG